MTKGKSKRLPIIDILKAFLIVLVIINHSNILPKNNLFFLLFVNPAVPAFMMLSGFVFAYQYWDLPIRVAYDPKKIRKKSSDILFR